MSLIASIFAGIGLFFSSIFSGHQAPPPQPLQTQQEQQVPAAQLPQNGQTFQSSQPQTQSQTQTSTQTNPSSSASASAAAQESVALPQTGSAYQNSLPLGDYKYTTSGAKQGYVYVCNVAQGGGGAQGTPIWIHGSTWDPAQKVSVEGSVSWPSASYSMTVSGSTRTITANGLPTDHPSGIFPIASSDPAHQFDANPNSIKAQNYDFSLPAYPSLASIPNCIFGEVGIMNDGVALFDGFDAEYRDAVAHETQDAWEAHPDEAGVYHYHGFESGYLNDSVSTVVGFAFDGFPITGGKLPDGTYVTSAQLDECHGLTSAVTLDGKTVTTYHYVLTQDFPYSVSCFRGKSYEPKPGGGNQNSGLPAQAGSTATQNSGTAGQSGPPAAAISACNYQYSGSACSFSTQNGTISGTCKTPPNQTSLACVPN